MDIFEELLTGSQSSQVSPELLETLGKQAAKRFVEQGEALNESIVKLAAQHSQLENEHIKRVVEFANNETFQQLFQKEADKNIHFPVADAGVVIRDLKDGGSPAHDGKTLVNSSYGSEPSRSDAGMDALSTAFSDAGTQNSDSSLSKLAGVHTEGVHANPADDVYDQHINLQAAHTKLAEAHESFDLALKAAKDDFYKQAKAELLSDEGACIDNIIQAVKIASPNDSTALALLKPMTEQLVREGVLSSEDFSKTASVGTIINPAHPLVSAVAGIVKLAQEKVKSLEALSQVEGSLDVTNAFLQDLS